MFRFLSLFIFLIGPVAVFAQGKAKLFNNDGKVSFTMENKILRDSAGIPVFTVNGNIIFNGNSQESEDMIYLIRSKDVNSKDIGLIYNPDLSQILFNTRKSKFYSGESRFEDNRMFEINYTGKSITIMDAQNGNKLSYGIVDDVTNTELIALLLAHFEYKMMSDETLQRMEVRNEAIKERPVTVVKPMNTNNFYLEWIWDGKILKPRWGNRPEDEWIFDGKYLRPYWGVATAEEWIWDGRFLKPYWNDIPEMTYIWDGLSLKPYWDYDSDAEWIFDPDMARPKFDTDYRKEWEIRGDIPVPVLAIIVLGIADRRR